MTYKHPPRAEQIARLKLSLGIYDTPHYNDWVPTPITTVKQLNRLMRLAKLEGEALQEVRERNSSSDNFLAGYNGCDGTIKPCVWRMTY